MGCNLTAAADSSLQDTQENFTLMQPFAVDPEDPLRITDQTRNLGLVVNILATIAMYMLSLPGTSSSDVNDCTIGVHVNAHY